MIYFLTRVCFDCQTKNQSGFTLGVVYAGGVGGRSRMMIGGGVTGAGGRCRMITERTGAHEKMLSKWTDSEVAALVQELELRELSTEPVVVASADIDIEQRFVVCRQ